MTFKTVTRNYIRNSSHRAFTLVELLVVIAIISILVGLLMPAAMNAQNEARRAQCQENLRNVAMALVNYESSKNYFPGYVSKLRGQDITWFTAILEQLGYGDLYKTIATGQTSNLTETPHLSVLNCPSDSRIKCKQSYRINGGFYGSGSGGSGGGSGGGVGLAPLSLSTPRTQIGLQASDSSLRSTGLSFDTREDSANKMKVGLSQIVDGAANTILVGENSNNRVDWYKDKGQFQVCIMYTSDTEWGSQQYIINRNMDDTQNNIIVARPSSRHRGIALVAFADTHVISLKDSIQYNTYKMIMCPNDNGTSANIDINQIDNNYP